MKEQVDLERLLSRGVNALVGDILRAVGQDPAGSVYFLRYALAAKRAQALRHKAEVAGEHIPAFLIASIAGACNLQCAGCYDRANRPCEAAPEMERQDWARVFSQARALGVSAILLAGGEPLLRMDVIQEAARHPAILFPLFTNGTLLDEEAVKMFKKHRNLIPIISVEGDRAHTDARRGQGVYRRTAEAMARLHHGGLLFGASVTVTSENLDQVTGQDFVQGLEAQGCQAMVFVEYVPVDRPQLALSEAERGQLARAVARLRQDTNRIMIAFPGDEEAMGGCLAAGRGFFHISASGRAEPCPFSPYSDTSLMNTPLREALSSPLFVRLRANEALRKGHQGGCALFDQADTVRSML